VIHSLLGVLASLMCALTWAYASAVMADILQKTSTTPTAVGLMKVVLAAPMLLIACQVVDVGWPRAGGHGAAVVASAVLGVVVADTTYMMTLKRLGVARAVFVIPLVPSTTALFAWLALHEQLSTTAVLGAAVTLVGVVVAVKAPAAGAPRLGLAGVVVAGAYVVSQAASNVVLKGALVDTEPLHIATIRLMLGGVLFVPLTVRDGGLRPLMQRSTLTRLAMAVGLGTGAGMWLGAVGMQRLPVAVATTLAATTPVWALVLAAFRGERPSRASLWGAVLAVLGVALIASSMR
jgi:drug/metabolite transporter (DMT)-like permease